jgi:Family of unknown function (DUF6308)
MTSYRSALVDILLNHELSPDLVAAFFDPSGAFEGDLLHTLPGNAPDEITIEDLFAVTMLDVSVAPRGVRRLLFDEEVRRLVSTFLAKMPSTVEIWEQPDLLGAGTPAWQLYGLLQRQGDRVGPVTAGKLLARKRPHLVPIVDSIVEKIFGGLRGRACWPVFVELLSSASRRERLVQIRPPDVATSVSLLRILDVTLWMWGSQGRSTKAIRLELGMPAGGWSEFAARSRFDDL